MEVAAGFIVGFDSDTPGIFQRQIDFIQRSGIITAMVGLLNAPSRTKLYKRLKEEGRILRTAGGDNTDYTMNFIPRMNRETLLEGYQKIVSSIYSSRAYHERLKRFMSTFRPRVVKRGRINRENVMALLRSVLYLGILDRHRIYYWRLMGWSIFKRPELVPMAVTYSIFGYHFRKVYRIDR